MKYRKLAAAVGLFTLVLLGSCSSNASFTVSTSLSSSAARFAEFRGCTRATCHGSPTSMSIKLYAAHVSTSDDCSGAVKIADHGTSGKTINLGVDKLIEETPADGTYKCLILEMSDNLSFVPDSTAVAAFTECQSGATSTFDIYRTDSGDTWKDMMGTTITATGTSSTPGDDRVVVYATTSAAAVIAGSMAPHTNQTITLTSSLTVPGNTTFYVDFRDGITASGGLCKIEDGAGMGFR